MKKNSMIGKILGVGGLVAALGCASGSCRSDYSNDVRSVAELKGWQNMAIESVTYGSLVCGRADLYKIKGTNPDGKYASAAICCGCAPSSGCEEPKCSCEFKE